MVLKLLYSGIKDSNETTKSDLELIRDLRNKRGDLLHESIHTALTAGLKESGDGECGDATV